MRAEFEKARQEFDTAKTELHHWYAQIDGIHAGQPRTDIISILKNASLKLNEVFKIAERTEDDFDNAEAATLSVDFKTRLANRVGAGAIPGELRDYFVGYFTYLLSKHNFQKHSDVQAQVVTHASTDMVDARNALGWPELDTHYGEQAADIATLTSIARDNPTLKREFDRPDPTRPHEYLRIVDMLDPPAGVFEVIDWNELKTLPSSAAVGAPPLRVSPIHPDVIDLDQLKNSMTKAALKVDGGTTGRDIEVPLTDNERQFLSQSVSTLESESRRFNGAQYAHIQEELNDAIEIIYRILHEDRVISADARSDPNVRKFLRPTTKEIDDNVYGEMMMLRGEWGNRLDKAEALGLIVANAPDKRLALEPADVEFLQDLLHRIHQTKLRYTTMLIGGDGVLEPSDVAHINTLITEIDKYSTWVNEILTAAGTGYKDVDHIATSGLEVGEFADIPNYSLALAIDRLITADFPDPSNAKKVENAYRILAEKLRHESQRPGKENLGLVGDMFDLMNTMYVDGTLNKATVLDLDYISYRWETGKDKLGSGNAIERYDKLRQMQLYQDVVKKLSDRAFMHMLDATSSWKANGDWSGRDHIRALFEKCHKELYEGVVEIGRDGAVYFQAPDAAYKAMIDSFPEDSPYPRDDVIAFLKDVAWYDSTLNDFRTYAAMVHLGVLKSSFKHRGGQAVEPTASVLNGGYQAKNLDRGKWAVLFGALIKSPTMIEKGRFRLSDFIKDIPPGHPAWDKEFFAGGPGTAPTPPGPGASPAEVEKYQDALMAYQTGLSQRQDHERAMREYEELISAYFKWMFGGNYPQKFGKWDPDATYAGQPEDTVFLIPTVSSFLRAPLDADGKRAPNNNAENYFKSMDATAKLIELSTTAFAHFDQLSSNPVKARTEIRKVAKEVGTELAKAYGYSWAHKYLKPNEKINEETRTPPKAWKALEAQRQFLRVTAKFILIRLIAQLPWEDDAAMLNPFDARLNQYKEYLELFVSEVNEYAEGNTSFNIWNGFFTKVYKEITDTRDFRRKARLFYIDARADYWDTWYKIAMNKGKLSREVMFFRHPHRRSDIPEFPYPEASKSESNPTK